MLPFVLRVQSLKNSLSWHKQRRGKSVYLLDPATPLLGRWLSALKDSCWMVLVRVRRGMRRRFWPIWTSNNPLYSSDFQPCAKICTTRGEKMANRTQTIAPFMFFIWRLASPTFLNSRLGRDVSRGESISLCFSLWARFRFTLPRAVLTTKQHQQSQNKVENCWHISFKHTSSKTGGRTYKKHLDYSYPYSTLFIYDFKCI